MWDPSRLLGSKPDFCAQAGVPRKAQKRKTLGEDVVVDSGEERCEQLFVPERKGQKRGDRTQPWQHQMARRLVQADGVWLNCAAWSPMR
ncbi:uncharacterized protein SPSK_05744 [Sporothrix schenckii 1099-18]|uniref:Uncharacterized protein n=1 Tax=Sporothrix schenckii 1099-18 TaxID=1397361 RepID=A0A0F2LW92_SPOSC|nr:uncharacterized protein SPSK_05744 [Sporothrix schenckii 1099-18]KJR80765.1 hypothetical protein SPSK_05744 [Sporothrix schenckii 1099-18]